MSATTHRLHLAAPPATASHPDPLNLQILRGDHDSDLDALDDAVHERRGLLDDQRASLMLAQARPGQRVRLTHHIRPKYLIGAHATITAITGDNIHVRLDCPIRNYGPNLRCDPILIEPAHAPE